MYKYFLMLSFFLMTSALAMDFERLTSEVEEVKAYAQVHPNLTLVLGETTDLSQYKKYDVSYVFLDGCHTVAMTGQRLTADFNSLKDLGFLASHLSNLFARILLDQSTFHHTDWHLEHLGHFKSMLQPAGVFQFQPYHSNADTSFSGCVFEDYETFKAQAKQKLSERLSDKDIKSLALAEIEPGSLRVLLLSASDQSLVDAKVKLYQELTPYAMSLKEFELELYGVSDDEENDSLQDQFKDKRAKMRAARAERGMAEESRQYLQKDLEDIQELSRQFTLDALNQKLVGELDQEVYFPYLLDVLARVFSAVEIVKEAYPQYPKHVATFVKAVK